MLKHILLASVVMISAPVFAQTAPVQETTPPAQETAPPPADAPEATPAPAPSEPAPTQDTTTPAPAPTPKPTPTPTPTPEPQTAQQDAAPAEAAPAQQPATATQIATIVDQGFPTYDKDSDGSLKTEEFGAWMVALRSATEPAFTGQSAADKEWIGKALAMADTDKSGGVSNAELKGFLAPQPAAS